MVAVPTRTVGRSGSTGTLPSRTFPGTGTPTSTTRDSTDGLAGQVAGVPDRHHALRRRDVGALSSDTRYRSGSSDFQNSEGERGGATEWEVKGKVPGETCPGRFTLSLCSRGVPCSRHFLSVRPWVSRSPRRALGPTSDFCLGF